VTWRAVYGKLLLDLGKKAVYSSYARRRDQGDFFATSFQIFSKVLRRHSKGMSK
jgi:hypothetical protein